jgi:hypothetical protein
MPGEQHHDQIQHSFSHEEAHPEKEAEEEILDRFGHRCLSIKRARSNDDRATS